MYDGYLADMEVAWDLAYTQATRQIENNAPTSALAECVRYALIQTLCAKIDETPRFSFAQVIDR